MYVPSGRQIGLYGLLLELKASNQIVERSFKISMVKTTKHYGPSGKKCWSHGLLAAGCLGAVLGPGQLHRR